MKIPFLLICCYFIVHSCAAQKNDYIWLLGYNDHYNDTITGTKIDFNYTPPRITNHKRNLNFVFDTNSSICDSAGNLQFYTNGVNVMNFADQVMENGYHLLKICDTVYGCEYAQTVLSLPFPGSAGKYVMLMEDRLSGYSAGRATGYNASGPLMYNIVDMSANNGKGALTEVRKMILNDTMSNHLTAVRHANGRDWWILAPREFTNVFYRLLLSPDGLKLIGSESIDGPGDSAGESFFSPDGSLYVRLTGNLTNTQRLDIFHFDRCGGLLSGPVVIYPLYDIFHYPYGIAFSPNSRFLYLTIMNQIFQYDLTRPNIEASKITVAVYDGFTNKYNNPTLFGLPRLAPDGKIYVATLPNTYMLHVIEQPDSAGLACRVLQHAVLLPTNNSVMPNYPFFRLGALRGSPCDTLTPTADVSEKRGVKLYPNPANGPLTLELGAPLRQPGRFLIYDRLGRLAYSAALPAGMDVFHPEAAGLAAGMYICKILEGDATIWVQKLAIINN